MFKRKSIGILATFILLILALAGNAAADLQGVSTLDPAIVNPTNTDILAVKPAAPIVDPADIPPNILVDLANGFPMWYQAFPGGGGDPGTKLGLCTDQKGFCLLANILTAFPISFPFNFGPEVFYWSADASQLFNTSVDLAGAAPRLALLVLGLEGGFATGSASEGQQAVFARIRIRVDVPVEGQVLVTHPFGQAIYDITPEIIALAEGGRAINETQDLGNFLLPGPFGDWTAALFDGPAAPEIPGDPNPRVDDLLPDRSIGPFLTWDTFVAPPGATDPALVDPLTGNRYVGFPGTELALVLHPIAGSPLNTNFFRVQFIPTVNTPPGFVFQVNDTEGDGNDTITVTDFAVSGKLYNDGANIAPVAVDDFAGVAPGGSTLIDVVANDMDVRQVGTNPFDPADVLNINVHGLNPQAISLDTARGGYLTSVTTANGGTVTREFNIALGKAFFRYVPAAGFLGTDTFQYVVQDTGGLRSALNIPGQTTAATVTVQVEDQTISAVFRPKLMKWELRGVTSVLGVAEPTGVAGQTLFRTGLFGAQSVPVVASPARGNFTLTLDETAQTISFTLVLPNLAAMSSVTAANIHLGATGTNGPVLFALLPPAGIFPTNGILGPVTLTAAELQTQPGFGINSFADAAAAILSGETYVNVHTEANPDGEIRGQIGRNVMSIHAGPNLNGQPVGAAEVQPDGNWRFRGKSMTSPGASRRVSVVSSIGTQFLGLELNIR